MTDFNLTFQKITVSWFYSKPLYFKILCLYKPVPCTFIGVPIRCGKNLIEYNPYLICEQSIETVKNELELEIKRIILRHPYRRKPKNCNDDQWLLASNLTINQSALVMYHLEKGFNIEYYYEALTKEDISNDKSAGDSLSDAENKKESEEEQENKKNIECNKNNSNENENTTSTQNSLEKESCLTDEQNKKSNNSEKQADSTETNSIEKSVCKDSAENKKSSSEKNNNGATGLWGNDEAQEVRLDSVIRQNQNLWGTLPAHVQSILKKECKAKVPEYKKVLHYMKSSTRSDERTLTRLRPSRRFGFDQMGSRFKNRPSKILIFVDTSGSISVDDLTIFYSAIKKEFAKSIKHIDVMQFDCVLQTEKLVTFNKRNPVPVTGGGGTDFTPVFDFLKKKSFAYDSAIVFTDGEAPIPKIKYRTRTRLCWILINKCQIKPWMKKTGLCTFLQS